MIVLFDLATQSDMRPSPFCWRAKLALKHKGLRFEARGIGFHDIRSLGDGSFKTLPVVRDGERWVGGSMAAAEYFEMAYPDAPALFPRDPERLFTGFVESWVDSTVHTQMFPMVALDIWERLFDSDKDYFRRTREARLGMTLELAREYHLPKIPALRASLEPLRRVLKVRPFLAGAAPAYSDYMVFGALKWFLLASSAALLEASDPIEAWFLQIDNFAHSTVD